MNTKTCAQERQALAVDTERLLGGLGDSPSVVADRLHTYGVRGVPGNLHSCAIARYLQAVVGTDHRVRKVLVSPTHVRLLRPGLRRALDVAVPPVVTGFIRAFDSGCFPELTQTDSPRRPSVTPG